MGLISTIYLYDHPWAVTPIYCKIRTYLLNASQQISRFMIVTACFDRFALCSTNFHFRQFSRVNIARYYMIPSIIIVWLIFPMHILIYNTVVNNSCSYLGTIAFYHSIYAITMVGFIPPLLMLIFSLLTFYNLKRKQQRQRGRQLGVVNIQILTDRNRKQQKRDQQVLAMLMIQVLAYFSTTTITSINLLYSTLTTYLGVIKSNERKSIESFITFILNTLNYTCPCLSFYLFCFVSHLYRKQLKLTLLAIRRRYCSHQPPRNHNGNNPASSHIIPVRQLTARISPIERSPNLPLPFNNEQHEIHVT